MARLADKKKLPKKKKLFTMKGKNSTAFICVGIRVYGSATGKMKRIGP